MMVAESQPPSRGKKQTRVQESKEGLHGAGNQHSPGAGTSAMVLMRAPCDSGGHFFFLLVFQAAGSTGGACLWAEFLDCSLEGAEV